VLRRLTVYTAEHHDAELVHDSLPYMEPTQVGVKKPRQASLKLIRAVVAEIAEGKIVRGGTVRFTFK